MASRFPNRRRCGRWRLSQRDIDEVLHCFGRPRDSDSQASEQCEAEEQLNGGDRGERKQALPRPNRAFMLCIRGH
jgi:hypothetical protein